MPPASSPVELMDLPPIGISYDIVRYSVKVERPKDGCGLSLYGLIVLLRCGDVDTL